MFRSSLRPELLSRLRMGIISQNSLIYDLLVSVDDDELNDLQRTGLLALLAKLAPVMRLLLLLTPPATELDLNPRCRPAGLAVSWLSLPPTLHLAVPDRRDTGTHHQGCARPSHQLIQCAQEFFCSAWQQL